MQHTPIFSPFTLNGSLKLNNRIIMAPMTRSFANDTLVPTIDMAKYYGRRASAGLIITEGAIVRPDGQGYPNTPGIFNDAQIDGWKKITDTVHQKEGKIFCQLWHVGRASHPTYLNGSLPVAPSAVKLSGRVNRGENLQYGTPRALDLDEIPNYIESFVQGAINALEAGFDGVEIHGAHGYLIDEFLHYDTNRRDDEYGGSPENMSRFLLSILDRMIKEIGNEKIGVRLSPSAYFKMEQDNRDGNVFKYLLQKINKLNIAYIHQGIVDPEKKPNYFSNSLEFLREHYTGNLIANGNYTVESALQTISNNNCDLISFGKPFISNPDFVDKIKKGEPLLPYNSEMLKTLY